MKKRKYIQQQQQQQHLQQQQQQQEQRQQYFLRKEVFDSGLVIPEPNVLIHPDILTICRTIENKFNRYEFSIMLKGIWTQYGFEIGNEYYIPKQKVSVASVDYTEDISKYRVEQGFNTILHRHPDGLNRFSTSDEESINSHFDCSLLYCNKNIVLANMILRLENGVRLSITLDSNDISYISNNITINDIDNIQEESYKQYLGYYGNYNKLFNKDEW